MIGRKAVSRRALADNAERRADGASALLLVDGHEHISTTVIATFPTTIALQKSQAFRYSI
jgi:hypothetical protein